MKKIYWNSVSLLVNQDGSVDSEKRSVAYCFSADESDDLWFAVSLHRLRFMVTELGADATWRDRQC